MISMLSHPELRARAEVLYGELLSLDVEGSDGSVVEIGLQCTGMCEAMRPAVHGLWTFLADEEAAIVANAHSAAAERLQMLDEAGRFTHDAVLPLAQRLLLLCDRILQEAVPRIVSSSDFSESEVRALLLLDDDAHLREYVCSTAITSADHLLRNAGRAPLDEVLETLVYMGADISSAMSGGVAGATPADAHLVVAASRRLAACAGALLGISIHLLASCDA